LLKRAGLLQICFHDLRHTAATLLLARGVNVKVVSELLGHSSVAVTLTLYGHVLPHMQRDAAVAMDRALRGALLPNVAVTVFSTLGSILGSMPLGPSIGISMIASDTVAFVSWHTVAPAYQ
jgi:hypothetical protein